MGKFISIFLIIVLFLLSVIEVSRGNTFLPYTGYKIIFGINNILAITFAIIIIFFISNKFKEKYFYFLSLFILICIIFYPFMEKNNFQKIYGTLYSSNNSEQIMKYWGYYTSFLPNFYKLYLPEPYFEDDINGYCKILNYFGKTDQLINEYYYIVDQSLNLGINNNILSCIDNKELYKLMIEFTKKEKFCLEKYGKIDRIKKECGLDNKIEILILLNKNDDFFIGLNKYKFEEYFFKKLLEDYRGTNPGLYYRYKDEKFLYKNF